MPVILFALCEWLMHADNPPVCAGVHQSTCIESLPALVGGGGARVE